MAPEILFGTGMIGTTMSDFGDSTTLIPLLQVLKRYNINRLDTAARYPPTDPGRAEQLLGEASLESHAFTIDTKVLASNPKDPSGDLTRDAVNKSVADSLTRLKLSGVDTLYAHVADPTTPVEEQVAAFNLQIQTGKCRQYGLSNHSIEQVKAILHVCEEKGLQKPALYQGDYNMITRGMEAELLPLLRQRNMHYFAYRPLAGGFLSGKLVNGEADGTRLGKDSPLGAAYQQVFGAPELHQALRDFQTALEQYHVSSLEVAMRWIYYHSALSEGDGLILGARSTSQFEQNMQWLSKGVLPPDVVNIVEHVWDKLRESRHQVM